MTAATAVSHRALLEVSGLSKRFFGVEVLKQVSFSVGEGEVVGLIGENGSGKSTTMNLINGTLRADGGNMVIQGRPYSPQNAHDATVAGIALIHQELNLFSNLSVAENLSIKSFPRRFGRLPFIDRRAVFTAAADLLAEVQLDVDPRTPVSLLAPGERQLVEIAKALALKPRLLIFDEPTTSLTARESERLFALVERLRAKGMGMIYVSHILEDVRRLCSKIVILRDGRMADGAPTCEMDISRMVHGMLGRPVDELFPVRSPSRIQPTLALEVNALTRPGQVKDINIRVARGEVVGLAGLMGSGRSETARSIFGLDLISAGEVRIGGHVVEPLSPIRCMAAGAAFLTEDRRGDGLLMPESIERNVELAYLSDLPAGPLSTVPVKKVSGATADLARSMHIRAHNLDSQPVQSLSGGNQQKVVLAKWLLRKPNLLILDEPTRGIDIGARSEIYLLIEQLAAHGTGVLMISSDMDELFGTCDRILVIAHGEIVSAFDGPDYSRAEVLAAAMRPQAGAH
ncbi:sugar ABC transporter ATP-binding protein [Mesorhizobium sp. ISC11]|uniref:sugar ABC transporter ATP-binding protein n=1 Tax=Mesorhizobium sp. ISC11 TaxID=3076428 RepID=UPI00301D745E